MAARPSSEELASQSEAKPSAGKDALDEQPLSSLPTDDVGELIEELRDRTRFVAEGPRYLLQLNERAASALSRLDEKYRIQFKATSHACNVADDERERADKAEDLNRKLVEGLRPFAKATPKKSATDRDRIDEGFGLTVGDLRKARSLLSSRDGGEEKQ